MMLQSRAGKEVSSRSTNVVARPWLPAPSPELNDPAKGFGKGLYRNVPTVMARGTPQLYGVRHRNWHKRVPPASQVGGSHRCGTVRRWLGC